DCRFACATAHLMTQLVVSDQTRCVGGHLVNVANRAEKSSLAVSHHFRQAANARSDNRNFTRHRFKCRESKRLLLRRQKQYIRGGEIIDDTRLLADERTLFVNAETTRAMLAVLSFTAVAHHHQARLHTLLQNTREDLHTVKRPLHRTEV